MEQPEAILKDSEKALRLYKAENFDRFDDLCTPSFWVAMTEILREELVKVLSTERAYSVVFWQCSEFPDHRGWRDETNSDEKMHRGTCDRCLARTTFELEVFVPGMVVEQS